MNEQGTIAFLLLIFVQLGALLSTALAVSEPDTDNGIPDLFDSQLQREYMAQVSYPNHQVERKAQRSPSLRLRFGRRSDPGLLPIQVKRFSDQINRKPIRSPSLRLRFGKRNLNDPIFDENENDIENYDLYRDIRKPFIGRLRWGKRDDIDFYINLLRQWANNAAVEDNERLATEWEDSAAAQNLHQDPSKRLRWGRSFNSDANTLASKQTNTNTGTDDEHVENTNAAQQQPGFK